MIQNPSIETLKDFHAAFTDEGDCYEYLFHARWPDGFVCPACGGPGVGVVATRALVRCPNGHQTSVTTGTAMHRTKQKLWDWLYTAFLISTSTTSISAVQLQRQLGLKRYEPAFMMLHKVRDALVAPGRERLHGEVEVDETYVGGPEKGKPGRAAVDKVLVVSAVEVVRWIEETPEGPKARSRCGRIRMSVIKDARQATLVPWVKANVEEGSRLVTDGHAGYSPLSGEYPIERHVANAFGKSTGDHLIHTGRVVSNFKAKIGGVYHGSVGAKHFQAYLNEYVFRFNRRFWRGASFERCVKLLLGAEALEYEDVYNPEEE